MLFASTTIDFMQGIYGLKYKNNDNKKKRLHVFK